MNSSQELYIKTRQDAKDLLMKLLGIRKNDPNESGVREFWVGSLVDALIAASYHNLFPHATTSVSSFETSAVTTLDAGKNDPAQLSPTKPNLRYEDITRTEDGDDIRRSFVINNLGYEANHTQAAAEALRLMSESNLARAYMSLLDILVQVTHHPGALDEHKARWELIVTEELERRMNK